MPTEEDGDAPLNPARDAFAYAYAVARATLSSVPILGPAAAEFMDLTVGPPLQKRRDEWVNRLYEEIQTLAAKVDGPTPEALGANEEFVSVLMAATESVRKTHAQTKLDALRHAVLNTACRIDIDEVENRFSCP